MKYETMDDYLTIKSNKIIEELRLKGYDYTQMNNFVFDKKNQIDKETARNVSDWAHFSRWDFSGSTAGWEK